MTAAELLNPDLLVANPLMPVREALTLAAPYLHPSESTLDRWIKVGSATPDGGRVVLPTVRAGGRLYTSTAAVRGFIDAQQPDEIDAALEAVFQPPAHRDKAADAAAAELERMGC